MYDRSTTPRQVAADIGYIPGTLGSHGLSAKQRTALKYFSRRYLGLSRDEVQGQLARMRYAYDHIEAVNFFTTHADNPSGHLERGKIDVTEIEKIDTPDYGLDDVGLPETPAPAPTPVAQPVSPAKADKLAQVAELLKGLVGDDNGAVTETRVIELIKQHAPEIPVTRVEIKTPEKVINLGAEPRHKQFETILKWVIAGNPVMLIGPAGSGKTTLAEQVAKALDVPFYFNGAITSEYKLSGFIDAQGRIINTPFRKAFETGGVYLFDEMDASLPAALLAFNAALANGQYDFPDGTVRRHEKFYPMAATNTFGKGADRIYVGRNQLDGASLDRFARVDFDYDEKLERALAGNDEWVETVQKVRRAVDKLKLRHIVSPRASIMGSRALSQGLKRKDVEQAWLWPGLDKDTIIKVRTEAGV
jgi:cobaltochelatase CobS